MLELRSRPRAVARRLYFLQLGYCAEHRHASSPATFLSDEGFSKIAKTLREAGKEKIDRRHTTLAWEPLTRTDLRRLGRSQHHTVAVAKTTDDDLPF